MLQNWDKMVNKLLAWRTESCKQILTKVNKWFLLSVELSQKWFSHDRQSGKIIPLKTILHRHQNHTFTWARFVNQIKIYHILLRPKNLNTIYVHKSVECQRLSTKLTIRENGSYFSSFCMILQIVKAIFT